MAGVLEYRPVVGVRESHFHGVLEFGGWRHDPRRVGEARFRPPGVRLFGRAKVSHGLESYERRFRFQHLAAEAGRFLDPEAGNDHVGAVTTGHLPYVHVVGFVDPPCHHVRVRGFVFQEIHDAGDDRDDPWWCERGLFCPSGETFFLAAEVSHCRESCEQRFRISHFGRGGKMRESSTTGDVHLGAFTTGHFAMISQASFSQPTLASCIIPFSQISSTRSPMAL